MGTSPQRIEGFVVVDDQIYRRSFTPWGVEYAWVGGIPVRRRGWGWAAVVLSVLGMASVGGVIMTRPAVFASLELPSARVTTDHLSALHGRAG